MVEFVEFVEAEWDAIRVGPNIVGWVGPRKTSRVREAYVTVVMGENNYRMGTRIFEKYCLDEQYALPELLRMKNEVEHINLNMFGYFRHVAVSVPDESLDITADGQIDYTVRSGETLIAAWQKFYQALYVSIQAELHTLEPIEVVRKVAEHIANTYSMPLGDQLMWRGQPLDDLLEQETTMIAKVIRPFGIDMAYSKSAEVKELTSARGEELLGGSTGFAAFVDWQLRSAYGAWRVRPEQVIHVRADTQEEYDTVENLFTNETDMLKRYAFKMIPDLEDASFFLSMTGDPLEEWVDGEKISAKELFAVWDEDE